uniref:hypothetical protein n=1 Tax=Enhygromyxa salina TaxID=215803 RepID=UPI00358F04BC
MGLEPDARLVVNREIDLRSLPLKPIEFFLFSRVEALSAAKPPTVADVVAVSGQPADRAREALERLLDLEVLTTSTDAVVSAPGAPAGAPVPKLLHPCWL